MELKKFYLKESIIFIVFGVLTYIVSLYLTILALQIFDADTVPEIMGWAILAFMVLIILLGFIFLTVKVCSHGKKCLECWKKKHIIFVLVIATSFTGLTWVIMSRIL